MLVIREPLPCPGDDLMSAKSVRAVERSFSVLAALATTGGASLTELEKATQLSRATLLRLLKTLIEVGAVRRGMKDHRYRNSVMLKALTGSLDATDYLAELSAPHLEGLHQCVGWPAVVSVPSLTGECDHMITLESTAHSTERFVSGAYYINDRKARYRMNMLMSGIGLAYLAHTSPDRCARHLERIRASSDPYNLMAIAIGDIPGRLQQVRQQGYATRHPLYKGGTIGQYGRDDRIDSLAVPIIADDEAIGALNIYWPRGSITLQEVVSRHFTELRETARAIGVAAAENGLFVLPPKPPLNEGGTNEELLANAARIHISRQKAGSEIAEPYELGNSH